MTDRLMYSSTSGQDATVVVETIQHAAPKSLRVTDPRYGLKSAAAKVHENQERANWFAQRDAAIAKQRAREAAALAQIDKDIASIRRACENGTTSNLDAALRTLTKLEGKRSRLVPASV